MEIKHGISKRAIKDIFNNFIKYSPKEKNVKNFLEYCKIEPCLLYKHTTFSELNNSVSTSVTGNTNFHDTLRKAFCKFSKTNSRRFLSFILDILPRLTTITTEHLDTTQELLFRMFYTTVWKSPEDWQDKNISANIEELSESKELLHEFTSLLEYQKDRNDAICTPINFTFQCPLDIHCAYTRDQILIALEFNKPSSAREGVKWLPAKNTDVLFVTLNKDIKDYSPSTMYDDHIIDNSYFNWQSQSTTSVESDTGQRYINNESTILLCVRTDRKDTLSGDTAPYYLLGTARHVKHEGSKPISITWKLDTEIPDNLFKKLTTSYRNVLSPHLCRDVQYY